MLTLIERRLDNHAGQARLVKRLSEELQPLGDQPISFRPQIVTLPMYAEGPGDLWFASRQPHEGQEVRRFWNAFGFYVPGKPQRIAIEINIPSDEPDRRVGGFFATDSTNGRMMLMHSGKVGGGLEGCTKAGFLQWLGWGEIDVLCRDRRIRKGVVVGALEDDDLVSRLRFFVREASAYKESVVK